MGGLAGFVMRGRRQAMWVAVVCAGIPFLFWLSAAVIGLVTLRNGIREGFIVLLWAMLPAVFVAYLGEIMPAAVLPGMVIVCGLLRLTVSWPWALCCVAGLGLLLATGLQTFGSAYLDAVQQIFGQMFAELSQRAGNDVPVELTKPTTMDIAGMFGLVQCVALTLCLMLARWWQAVLYNPGGFRAEFHGLRLNRWQVVALVTAALGLAAINPALRIWAWLPLLPLSFAGLGLTHALLAQRGKTGWLALFYAGLLLLPPVKELLMVLASMDGWLDLRRRWLTPPSV